VDPTVDAGSYVCSVRGNKGELARREVQLTVNSEYVKRATGLDENGAVQSATASAKYSPSRDSLYIMQAAEEDICTEEE
jgi:hypothetical protein